ncbi:hypothetical protein BDN70DRAFT_894009 [Pholiota conissans]|uniref:Uncharacterized protein n=1 Tax=Pholiota conissans TaxID=109636 RepID=A0A9P5Z328_9AGAR|nr:hypothetical protein BDN70DRAFT_894009 [Pholiota conissans]
MADVDNAKFNHGFKKPSKCMGDKPDMHCQAVRFKGEGHKLRGQGKSEADQTCVEEQKEAAHVELKTSGLERAISFLAPPAPQIGDSSSQDENSSLPTPATLPMIPQLLSPMPCFPLVQQPHFLWSPAPATPEISSFYPGTSPPTPLRTLGRLQKGLMRSTSAGSSAPAGQRMAMHKLSGRAEAYSPSPSPTSPQFISKLVRNNVMLEVNVLLRGRIRQLVAELELRRRLMQRAQAQLLRSERILESSTLPAPLPAPQDLDNASKAHEQMWRGGAIIKDGQPPTQRHDDTSPPQLLPNLDDVPDAVKRTQFIFSVDQLAQSNPGAPVKKLGAKSSAEFAKREKPAPAAQAHMNYSEGSFPSSNSEQFSISRPTIELALDDVLLNDDVSTDSLHMSWMSTFGASGNTADHSTISTDEIEKDEAPTSSAAWQQQSVATSTHAASQPPHP